MTDPTSAPALWLILVVMIPAFFVALWSAISLLIARVSGWHALAQHYRANAPFSGEKRRWASASMRHGARYRNTLTIGADDEGLALAMPLIFRPGHAPLRIPWGDISVAPEKFWGIQAARFSFMAQPDTTLLISAEVAAQMLKHAPRALRLP